MVSCESAECTHDVSSLCMDSCCSFPDRFSLVLPLQLGYQCLDNFLVALETCRLDM